MRNPSCSRTIQPQITRLPGRPTGAVLHSSPIAREMQTSGWEIWTRRRIDSSTSATRRAPPKSHPAWRGDGTELAWASSPQSPGTPGIYAWNPSRPVAAATWIGNGSWPAWSRDGDRMATVLEAPTQQFIAAFALPGAPLIFPTTLPGVLRGLAWPSQPLPHPLPPALQPQHRGPRRPLQSPLVATASDVPAGPMVRGPLEECAGCVRGPARPGRAFV